MAEIVDGALKLGRVEGIDTAEELLSKLREVADTNSAAVLDGGAVISVDSTTLQMLLVFIRELSQEGLEVSWSEVSKKLRKSSDMLGLSEELRLG